jgi:hypothetical protein
VRRVNGREYGQAADIAARLTTPQRPITAARIRRWAHRSRDPNDKLHGLLPAIHLPGARTGTTWYDLQHAAKVAALTRPRGTALL